MIEQTTICTCRQCGQKSRPIVKEVDAMPMRYSEIPIPPGWGIIMRDNKCDVICENCKK